MNRIDSFTIDEDTRRHHTLRAEPGSLSGKVTPLGKDGIRYVIPLGPHLMTPLNGPLKGQTQSVQGGNLQVKTFKPLRWIIRDDKTIWMDLGHVAITLTFGSAEECDRAIEQFTGIVGASS